MYYVLFLTQELITIQVNVNPQILVDKISISSILRFLFTNLKELKECIINQLGALISFKNSKSILEMVKQLALMGLLLTHIIITNTVQEGKESVQSKADVKRESILEKRKPCFQGDIHNYMILETSQPGLCPLTFQQLSAGMSNRCLRSFPPRERAQASIRHPQMLRRWERHPLLPLCSSAMSLASG